MAMSGKMHISLILLFCFSILLGHNLVPHHHHAEILPKAINADCPIEHKDHHASDNHPFHCHAFNNVVIFKDSPSHLQQRLREISKLIIPLTQCVMEPPAAFEGYRYICLTIPYKSFKYCGTISPRAPPASA